MSLSELQQIKVEISGGRGPAGAGAAEAIAAAAAAAASATAAAGSATAAATTYDNFDDRYLGAKSANPTLDNDGNALIVGALYFNTVGGDMRVWRGTAWQTAYTSVSGYSAGTGISIASTTISADMEAIQDMIAAFVAAGVGATVTYNDGANTLTIAADMEAIQDMIATFLGSPGSGITVTYNDAGNIDVIAVDRTALKPTEYLVVALSDLTTSLTTGDGKGGAIFLGYDFTITEFYIGNGTGSSSGVVTVDMNIAGSTILSTKATIGASQTNSLTGSGSVPAVISGGSASYTKGQKITFDVDAAGTGTKDLKAIFIGHRT